MPSRLELLGAIAYVVFSVAMGSGRLITDWLWARWGSAGLLRRCGALAGLGFAAGLAPATPPAASAGFAALGLGPLIGAMAKFTSLRLACGLLALAGLLVVALAPSAAVPRTRRGGGVQPSLTT